MTNVYLQQGIDLVQKAIQFDNQHKYSEAIPYYESALQALQDALQYERNPDTQRLIREKLHEYSSRVGVIKNAMAQSGRPGNNPMPGPRSYGPPPTSGSMQDIYASGPPPHSQSLVQMPSQYAGNPFATPAPPPGPVPGQKVVIPGPTVMVPGQPVVVRQESSYLTSPSPYGGPPQQQLVRQQSLVEPAPYQTPAAAPYGAPPQGSQYGSAFSHVPPAYASSASSWNYGSQQSLLPQPQPPSQPYPSQPYGSASAYPPPPGAYGQPQPPPHQMGSYYQGSSSQGLAPPMADSSLSSASNMMNAGQQVSREVVTKSYNPLRPGTLYLRARIDGDRLRPGNNVTIHIELENSSSSKVDLIKVYLNRRDHRVYTGHSGKVPKVKLGERDFMPDGKFPMREGRYNGSVVYQVPMAATSSSAANCSYELAVRAHLGRGAKDSRLYLPVVIV